MKILVLGSGGREHALAWKLQQTSGGADIFCAPGSAGMAADGLRIENANITDPKAAAALAERLGVDLTVVGPEAPLVAGVADEFLARGLKIVGPTAAAARLEGSKAFAKEFMRRHGIPTADFVVVDAIDDGRRQLGRFGFPVVLKADGLAAGKGVVVARDAAEAETTLSAMLSGEMVGAAGRRVVIEQFLPGVEVTFTVIANGRTAVPLAPTQDHKAAFEGDQGPNTGGMGAYCDDSIVDAALQKRILAELVAPTLAGMAADGTPYHGVLYFGLMVGEKGPRLLEYNARFGDPETQALMTRLSSDLVPVLLGGTPPAWSPGATVCVVASSKGYPGAFERDKRITGLKEAARLPNVKVFHAGVRESEGSFHTSGGRVLGVTASGASLSEAITRAYAAMDRIHFEGMHYRRDIGRKGLATSTKTAR